jgi:predicted transposase YdaD
VAERRRRRRGAAITPYDAAAKHLFERDPAAWLRYVGLAEADKVVRMGGGEPSLAHVEVQVTYDPAMPVRLLRYCALLHHRHGLPVASVLILLRPEADGPALTGSLALSRAGVPYLTFEYQVVRVWERPVEALLAGEIATLPLAPLADVDAQEAPAVLRRMQARLAREATHAEAADIWQTVYLLAGLRYEREVTDMIKSLGRALRESRTYQEILREGLAEGREKGLAEGLAEGREKGLAEGLAEGREKGRAEGRAEGERLALLRLGSRRLGAPDRRVAAAIDGLADLGRIERMIDRVLDARDWDDLLATE